MLENVKLGHLLADVGGTNARFALTGGFDALLECVRIFKCAEFERFEDMVNAYLQVLLDEERPIPQSACIAVAAPVHTNVIKLTNNPWSIDRQKLQSQFDFPWNFLNDFSAQAHCLGALTEQQLQYWQLSSRRVETLESAIHTRAIVGPGTGFGVCGLTGDGAIIESEAGHCSFAPVTRHEISLLECLWDIFPRVSVEHLLSGSGLANLYYANILLRSKSGFLMPSKPEILAPQVVTLANQGDEVAVASVNDFVAILGSVSGDIALSLGSLDGFFLSGAMLEKMSNVFDRELFLQRFRDKGPFTAWCEAVPIARIKHPYPGLVGCAVHAKELWEMSQSGGVSSGSKL